MENKLTADQAKAMQAMSLAEKYSQTFSNICDWYFRWTIFNENAGAYVSFSGGKDSTVLAYIAAQVLSDIFKKQHIPLILLFCDTGLEYPEIKDFVKFYAAWLRNQFPGLEVKLEIRRPKKSFKQVITEYGYPIVSKDVANCVAGARKGQQQRLDRLNGTLKTKDGKLSQYNIPQWKFLMNARFKSSDKCCVVMKKSPAHIFGHQEKLMCITAEMAAESRLRKQKWIQQSCNGFDLKEPKSMAMAFWNEQDVLRFVFENNLPIVSVYGEIEKYIPGQLNGQIALFEMPCKYRCTECQRTGCIFCGFGAHLEKGENRYQRLKRTHPQLWDYCINGGEYVNGMWQPNNKGLGFRVPLDFIGVKYE